MMKRTKLTKTLVACLAAAMAVSVAGCGGGGGQSSAPAADNNAPAADNNAPAADNNAPAADNKGGDVTISFMGWEASPLETDAVKNGISIFESENPGIKVSYTPSLSGAEYTAKLLSTVAGDSTPDVMFMQSSDYRMFASRGVLTEVTDKFSEEFSLDDFVDSARQIMEIDGHVFGIQSCIVTPVLYYNKDIFDAAGIPYPSASEAMQWEDFRQLCIQLTTDDVYGCYGQEVVSTSLNAFLQSNGAAMYTDDMNTCTVNSPEAIEVLNAIRDLRIVDNAAPDATTLENIGMSANQMLQTGRVAMLIDGSWALQELASIGFPVDMAPIPYFKTPTNIAQAHLHCISARSPHQDESWEFLKFLSGMNYQGALVKSGLWMPNRISMYEDAAVNEWFDPAVHGSYKQMLGYFKDAKVQVSALQKSSQCSDILTEETDKFFKDGQATEATVENLQTRINEVLERLAAEG